MTNDRTTEQRVDAAIAAYLTAVDEGQAPAREEFLLGFPDIAGELRVALDAMQGVAAAADAMFSDAATSDNFGGALAIVGGTVVIGAENDDPNGNNSGSAYFYELEFGSAYCFGDGSGLACPCGNESTDADGQGCTNSLGRGARLEAPGGTSGGTDHLALIGQGMSAVGLAFHGPLALNGGNGAIFGDGLRCAGGQLVRLSVIFPDAMGNAQWGPGLSSLGGWSAGDTRYFQIWYRDTSGPCGTGFNVSNGLEIVFEP